MADELGYKQVSNVTRRSWDKELYEKRAKERLERGEEFEAEEAAAAAAKLDKRSFKEEFQAAAEGSQGPAGSRRAFLKARTTKVDLESRLHKTQVITSAAAGSQQGGYWCEVCKCLVKDSIAYLDHINGKKHQRALGFSMRVERSTVGAVKGRLEALRARTEEAESAKAAGAPARKSAVQEYEERLVAYADAEKRERAERREAERAAKEAAEHEEEQDEEATAIAAAMGFGGFSGGKR